MIQGQEFQLCNSKLYYFSTHPRNGKHIHFVRIYIRSYINYSNFLAIFSDYCFASFLKQFLVLMPQLHQKKEEFHFFHFTSFIATKLWHFISLCIIIKWIAYVCRCACNASRQHPLHIVFIADIFIYFIYVAFVVFPVPPVYTCHLEC